ncbi:MAG: 4-coumarate--CoA ligase [Ilumatobacteraceae bacterium]|nr:4-coumarate--CoA ligase [Ilumatobacteraceae bacterium]
MADEGALDAALVGAHPSTVTELLGAWASERPADVIVVERFGARRTLTVGELVARTDAVAEGLAAVGASAARPIVVWLPNRIEWIEVIAAAARLGAPIIGLNTRYRADELRHVLQRSGAGVLVAVDDFAGIHFADLVAESGTGALSTVVIAGEVGAAWGDLGCRVVAWDEIGGALDGSGSTRRPPPRPADLVAAFTTSGTTGFPKLAAHDQAGVVRHALDDAAAFDVRPGDRMLVDLPLCGVFGFNSMFAAIGGRATTLLNERFDPVDTATAISAERVTHYNASDDMLLRVMDAGLVRAGQHEWREGAFANFVNAGRRAAERAEVELGVRLSGVYGMSEMFALLSRWPAAMTLDERARAGGIPVCADLEVRVVDPETGAARGVGEEGELSFRGPPVLACYLGDPDATGAALATDGWFRSGDLGRLTGDGGFEYLARLGDSLRLRGFLVDPAEIERRLELHPAIDVAQVVGVERPGVGQVAVAFVRLAGGYRSGSGFAGGVGVEGVVAVGVEELRAHCAAGIANFKVPAHVVIVDAFPTVDGPNGVKIRKRELRDRAAHELDDRTRSAD